MAQCSLESWTFILGRLGGEENGVQSFLPSDVTLAHREFLSDKTSVVPYGIN